jgi:hypothetical protein
LRENHPLKAAGTRREIPVVPKHYVAVQSRKTVSDENPARNQLHVTDRAVSASSLDLEIVGVTGRQNDKNSNNRFFGILRCFGAIWQSRRSVQAIDLNDRRC